MTDEVVLAAENVTKHFAASRGRRFGLGKRPPVRAVEDVSLNLTAGRITAMVGESGCGKSTVARMLARIYPPTKGRILLRGKEVTDSRAYRRNVQMVFQDPFASLNPFHKVHYHLARPLKLHGHARTKAEVDEQVAALLERVSLTPVEQFMHKLPHELSGGQRQRVAIARALAAQPVALIADEPVSMLDVSIRLGVLRLLEKLAREENLALLYITHDIASARYFADDILVMYAGQLIEQGPSQRVTDDPAHPYTKLLLSAAPDPDQVDDEEDTTDHGEPPSLISPPSGCRFHPRCPVALPTCSTTAPLFTALADDHHTACHLYDPATVAG
ncbi:ABC transporter ATP-binding protein [Actinocatenispora rupis]|uniref:Dipeptide/oligopeptide/nickel ABC transporter ATP-binding protein n=1 Tax=Actinocatenispora rupis TaxID=519421 RepID=A0A8J3J0C5_9ACTN|nr:ABC transporter ATP-binding protein [Actinocatenispora rupis]GID13451.1 dipeptide/oligopeptide/nickel ABC transporter ATP-binding protein [Actinocatenispora rupis]